MFSAQDWPGRWYPYGEGHIVLRRAVASEGCMLTVCNRDLQCLTDITVEDVMRACRSILERSEARGLNADLLVSEVNAN
jgi:hypothetical protein